MMLPNPGELVLGVFSMVLIGLVLVSILVWAGKKFTKKMSQRLKKGWLIAHMLLVIIYFSGVIGATLLALSTLFITEDINIYAAHFFIQYFDWFVIIPGGIGSLITGIWLAVRTNWGVTKYYWVMAKWIGTIGAIAFGGNFMRYWFHDNFHVIFEPDIHPLQNPLYLQNREEMFFGLVICFVILIFLFIISYLKPWGKRNARE
jgi:hypothetical protein